MEANQQAYERKDVVSLYDQMELQPAEVTIFSELQESIAGWSVLDIGMGAGRTTEFLLPRSKKYLGVDYSRAMVEHCQNKFHRAESFQFADARDLSSISKNGPFDFVMFSFNGIDCVPLDGRERVFKEIRKVLKEGGMFCFSSHNINFDLSKCHSVKFTSSPLQTYRYIRRFFEFRFHNPNYSQDREKEKILIKDGTSSFQVDIFYSKPGVQVQEIRENGFQNIRAFSHLTGKEVALKSLDDLKDPWIYYLCQRN